MNLPLLNLEIRLEVDVVLARQRARQIAGLLGFAPLDQTRISTATSEIARNAVKYAGGARLEFIVESGPVPAMAMSVRERGPGIPNLQDILNGGYESASGLGLGIIGAKRLMDRFEIESTPGVGSSVLMAKNLPARTGPVTPQEVGRIAGELARPAQQGLLDELQQQNQELLSTLQELRSTQSEIAQMHSRELDETNRGVLALYAELDEGAKALQRLSDLKSRFLSEMSHEFRSPLNSIKGLTGILLARTDGDLSGEQEKQIQFIRQACDGLATLVDDLLDLARVEAGKAAIRLSSFRVRDLFEGLEGTIRPMIDRDSVALEFEWPPDSLSMSTDEGKVGQILRNFLTNAAKFTERGEICVGVKQGAGQSLVFSVKDSGIGIPPEHLNRIFDEYGQIENPLQRRAKGVGLGLPLTRKLAQLLGGEVSVRSEPGVGSEFFAEIPRVFVGEAERASGLDIIHEPGISAAPAAGCDLHDPAITAAKRQRDSLEKALIVDDVISDRYLIRGTLAALGQFEVIEAELGQQALSLARNERPDVIFLDLLLPDMSGFEILKRLKSDAGTRNIPVIIHTSKVLDDEERGQLTSAAQAILQKGNKSREAAIAQVRDSLAKAGLRPPVSQYAAEP
jgi:signal transduction histidine kinase